MNKHEFRFENLRVLTDVSVDAANCMVGKVMIFPRRNSSAKFTVFLQPNDFGRMTPHITFEDGTHDYLAGPLGPDRAGFTTEEFAAFFERAGSLMVRAFLARTKRLQSDEEERLILFVPKGEDVFLDAVRARFAAQRPNRWNVSVAKLARGFGADVLDLQAALEISLESQRPSCWEAVIVDDDGNVLERLMVGYHQYGVLRDDGSWDSPGWYRVPSDWTTDDLMVEILAGCGPGFWRALRRICWFFNVQYHEHVEAIERRALALRARNEPVLVHPYIAHSLSGP